MRIFCSAFALGALFASLGLAQSPFYFTQPASPQEMRTMSTLIRTIVDVQDLSLDESHLSIAVHGSEDKVVAADWLFHQLEKPTVQTAEYRMSGPNGELIKIFPVPGASTNAEVTQAVTAIRTITDVQRIFPNEAKKAIVLRGAADKIAATGWILGQLYPADGTTPTGDSANYPSPAGISREPDSVIHIFRLDPQATNSSVTAMVTAIRTIADMQRLFPLEFQKAIIANGTPDKVAFGQWLIGAVAHPSDGSPASTTLAGDSVRVFYTPQSSKEALTALTTRVRTTADLQRVFPLTEQQALVVRGPAGKMPVVEGLVAAAH